MILGISGKKQSGKGVTFRFIGTVCGRCDVPCREFSFAYLLKRMCVDILGLREEQAFGTDAEKNTEVPHLLWENFPRQAWESGTGDVRVECGEDRPESVWSDGLAIWDGAEYRPRTGPMTGRQVLQYWGSEIFRYAYNDVWAAATIRMVRAWLNNNPGGVAVITDVRFPNEVSAIKDGCGRVIHLTRNPFDDRHMSETRLDPDVYDWTNFDVVFDNADMSVAQQCFGIAPALKAMGVIPDVTDYIIDNAVMTVVDSVYAPGGIPIP